MVPRDGLEYQSTGGFYVKAVVVHSGGMDSSICLALARKTFGRAQVLSLSFRYGQTHAVELQRAAEISSILGVEHREVELDFINKITTSALLDSNLPIAHEPGSPATTEVVGRNGLLARIAAIYAANLGCRTIYLGAMGLEAANSGYRDCSRPYFDVIEAALRMDFGDESFSIETPLVDMTKKESYYLAMDLGILEHLLEHTISCYRGVEKLGCQACPACKLRNTDLRTFALEQPQVTFSYRQELLASTRT